MAHQAILLLRDLNRLSTYSANALEFSKQFSWDKTANSFDKVLNNQYKTNADVIPG
jgi:hypothetical protein